MKRECAYCGQSMGRKAPHIGPQANEITTGICPKCLVAVLNLVRKDDQPREVVEEKRQ